VIDISAPLVAEVGHGRTHTLNQSPMQSCRYLQSL